MKLTEEKLVILLNRVGSALADVVDAAEDSFDWAGMSPDDLNELRRYVDSAAHKLDREGLERKPC